MSTLITNRRCVYQDCVFGLITLQLFLFAGCATLPDEPKRVRYQPQSKNFYIELPTGEFEKRPYDVLGWVKSRASYSTMDIEHEIADEALCKNYYNKAAAELVKETKKAGGDAVIKVRSVVFLLDGKSEEHASAQCSDDGAEGEILLKGVAIKFKPLPKE